MIINVHSKACDNYINNLDKEENENEYKSWETYKSKLINYLESLTTISRKEFVNFSLREYNERNYNFSFNPVRNDNAFYYWKFNSIKFTKYYLLENPSTFSNKDYVKSYIKKLYIAVKINNHLI